MLETSQISMLTTMDDIAAVGGEDDHFGKLLGSALTADAAKKYAIASKPKMKNKKL